MAHEHKEYDKAWNKKQRQEFHLGVTKLLFHYGFIVVDKDDYIESLTSRRVWRAHAKSYLKEIKALNRRLQLLKGYVNTMLRERDKLRTILDMPN